MAEFNKTELQPYPSMEREILHRDLIAHVLRWTNVLNRAEIGMKVLDFGCGSGGLAETFYRNRFKPARFLGLEIRPKTVKELERKFPWAEFETCDLTKPLPEKTKDTWDLICSLEVIEHVNKKNGQAFVDNLASVCSENTIVLLSTPNFDPKVGAADNHTYDGAIQEYDHEELRALLESKFEIVKRFGTFASKRDYFHLLTAPQKELWNQLHEYYDSNLMSILFAPLFPKESRNCLWEVKLKS